MTARAYGTLAAVYEWLVPEAFLTPAGSVAAFDAIVGDLRPGARVLDCAAGTGELAVGLALRGFDVVATDASPAMIERLRALAARHDVDFPAAVRPWDELSAERFPERFDTVFCVGNSLAHAAGRAARSAALAGMASVLRPGGRLVLTARNWERERAAGSRLEVGERLVDRGGRRALVVHGWTIAEDWDDRHALEIAVALVGADGAVTTHAERLAFWPFRHATLLDDLHGAALVPDDSTYTDSADRYMVTATRPA